MSFSGNRLSVLGAEKRFFFFVDDNFAADLVHTRDLLRALIPLKIRWVTQMSINAAHDEEFLHLLGQAGCQGVLIGFESLNAGTLHEMHKDFNAAQGGYERAIENLRRHKIRIYATFVFGYDSDTVDAFEEAVEFSKDHGFYITAFNHLTPFPGTPLYSRLERENRLIFRRWWLDEGYSYNQIPFLPRGMTPEALQEHCLDARRSFYSLGSMLNRGFDRINRSSAFMFRNFFVINAMHRAEIRQRNRYPLGDEAWKGPYVNVT
ncbi:MAG: DUF4070 domain-containing protein [Pseudomonadota bacterium]|nr:DUF4070 domain-containing protein [Pseudomonadota bacterium]